MKSLKTISVYECIYEAEELVEERLINISRLNGNGKVLHMEQYDAESNLTKKIEYQYQGEHVIQTQEEDLIEKNINKTVCAYKDGKLVNQKDYLNDDLLIEMVYVYNEEGQLIKNDILNNDGSLSSRYTYYYSDLITMESFFDEELTLVRKTETTKDEEGRTTKKKITEIFEDREETNEQTIEHKLVDGESFKNYYNNGKEVYEIVECFDEEGRVIETNTYDVAKNEESVIKVEFNDSGKIIKELVTTNEEEVSQTNVTFDEYDNRIGLIKRVKVADDFFETSTYKFVNKYESDV